MNTKWSQWLAGVLIGVILAGAPGALLVLPQLSAIAKTLEAMDERVTSLETGRTTPMSAEARVRFDGVDNRIDQLQKVVDKISDGQTSILERLPNKQER